MSRFLADLQKAIQSRVEKVPKGLKTAHEIAKEERLSIRAARDQIKILLDSGLWERRDIKIQSGGQIRPVPHYGPKS